jgi:gamma-glutamyl-gamma-aminobutyrate hydrolase PuuD
MTNKRPRIGITLRVENIEEYNEKRDAISQEWVNLIEKIQGFPIFIPNTLSNIEEFLNEMKIDGLVLSGGDNKGDNNDRDITEQKLIQYGIKHEIPIIGICRGMQVINNYFGGSVKVTDNNKHVVKNHDVQIINNIIKEYTNVGKKEVNSFHHNIIFDENLGDNLKVFARSMNDNSIEGLFHETFPIIGVMWHPERERNLEEEKKLIQIFSDKKNLEY